MVELRIESKENRYNNSWIDLLGITSRHNTSYALITIDLHQHNNVYWVYPDTIITVKEDTVELETGNKLVVVDLKVEYLMEVTNDLSDKRFNY